MVSEFVREQKRYTRQDLCRILDCSWENAVPLIRRLKEFGVLSMVKATDMQRDRSELLEEEIELAGAEAEDGEHLYVFPFVGVIVVAGRVLKCYPKYLLHGERPVEELRQVLKVLEKFHANEQVVSTPYDRSERGAFPLLPVLLFLLQDYYENGVYSNTEDIIECNGAGEILWDKTINETFVFLSKNRPYYIELQTKKRAANEFDYFKRLHECVLTKASKELKEADLLDLFELTGVDLTDEDLDSFGETDTILAQIEKELNVQFNTRKQLVLKTIYSYLAHSGSLYDADHLSLFGTNRFNLVWEGVCAAILDNQLDVRLGALRLPVPLKPEYDSRQKLIELIEKPQWTATGSRASNTLIPDLIAITEQQFLIVDAKYYLARLELGEPPKGQPGVESVTKQYLYQLAYQRFLADHGFSAVKNCFLMPTERSAVENRGEAAMDMLSGLGLQSIQVRFLPAGMAYDCYLSGKKLDIRILDL